MATRSGCRHSQFAFEWVLSVKKQTVADDCCGLCRYRRLPSRYHCPASREWRATLHFKIRRGSVAAPLPSTPLEETALALLDDLRYWINLSHALAWQGTAQTQADPKVKTYWTPDEPGLVAALLDSRIQSGLELEFKKVCTGRANVRIDSIFTHKTPTVRFGGKTPVEIGDLLLVRQHFDTQTLTSQGKALLLQAKKNTASNSGSVSSGNPNTQFELYKGWAPFQGVTRLPVGPWNFLQTNQQGRFGEYLAVFEGHAHTFTLPGTLGAATSAFNQSDYPSHPPPKTAWANGPVAPTASAANFVQCPDDFAITLSDFFIGRAGESFVPGPIGTRNDWSDFVNTMIGEAAK